MPGKQCVDIPASKRINPKYICYILELPGELRNRIYHFAVEDRMIMFTPRRDQEVLHDMLPRHFLRAKILERMTNSDAPKGFPFTCQEDDDARRSKRAIRQFRSLTQVCRLIRNEYLPRYKRMIAHRVCHVDLEDYVTTVLMPECRRLGQQAVPLPTGDCIDMKAYHDEVLSQQLIARQNITRTIFVDCKSWEERAGLPRGRVGTAGADILPFLKFCINAPGIQAQCGFNSCACCRQNWGGHRKNLNRLFEVSKNPKLAAWLEGSVDEVRVNWPPDLEFRIKKGHGKKWMGDWTYNYMDSAEMREWEAEVGLWRDELVWTSISFDCFQSDWGLNHGREDVGIEKMIEEAVFWGRSDKGNKDRSKKPRQKVKCGKPKLERKKGRRKMGS